MKIFFITYPGNSEDTLNFSRMVSFIRDIFLDPNIKADTFDIIGYTETFTEEYIPCAIIFYERSKGYDGKKAIDQFLSPPIIMSGFRLLWNEVTQNREEFIKRLEKHEL